MRKTLLSLFAATVIFAQAKANADGWRIETVAPAGFPGEPTSIIMDKNDVPHISFCDWDMIILKYAKKTGNNWAIVTVDGDQRCGTYNSVSVDSFNRPRIAYYNSSFGQLKYARWTGTDWRLEVVDTGWVGTYASLVTDQSDRPHIAYYDGSNSKLKYAVKTGANWKIITVDDSYRVGRYCSIALDSKGNPHIAYEDADDARIKYAYLEGNRWYITTIMTIGTQYLDLTLDSKNRPHISHYRDNYPYSELRYAHWTGSEWEDEIVDEGYSTGRYTSIAVDQSDFPHISYTGSINGDLKYARFYGAEWEITVVESGSYGRYHTSIDLDSDQYPHISYYDSNIYSIKYARWDPTLRRTLGSFKARGLSRNVVLTWTLLNRGDLAGFNLYRQTKSAEAVPEPRKINAELIVGRSPYRYVDADVSAGTTYLYWLEVVPLAGPPERHGPVVCRGGVKTSLVLASCAPNPARTATTVAFSVPSACEVSLTLYDIAGRKVAVRSLHAEPGDNELDVDVSSLAPGVYTYRLEAGDNAVAKRMVVVR